MQYTVDIGKKVKVYHDGVLSYYPATRRAVLEVKDVIIDEAERVGAGGLIKGGEFQLSRTFIRIIKPVTEEDGDDRGIERGLERGLERREMVEEQYEILYTKEKSKKVQSWKDGWMRFDAAKSMATFYDEKDDGVIHRKVIKSPEEISIGTIFETASYIIEITSLRACENQKLGRFKADKEDSFTDKKVEEKVEFEMLYTADKVRKAKRWKDGHLRWDPIKGQAVLYDEEERIIFRKGMRRDELVEDAEFSSGMYIFQLGSIRVDSKDKSEPKVLGAKRECSVMSETGMQRKKSPMITPKSSIKSNPLKEEPPIPEIESKRSAFSGRNNADLVKLLKKS